MTMASLEKIPRAGHGRETVCVHDIACLVTAAEEFMTAENPLGKLYNCSVVFAFEGTDTAADGADGSATGPE